MIWSLLIDPDCFGHGIGVGIGIGIGIDLHRAKQKQVGMHKNLEQGKARAVEWSGVKEERRTKNQGVGVSGQRQRFRKGHGE